jgi:hypothetical protein
MLLCFYFLGFSHHLRFVLSVCHCLNWFSFAQIWISYSSHLSCSRFSSRAGLVSATDFWPLCREAFGLRSSVLTSSAVRSASVRIFDFAGSFCPECMESEIGVVLELPDKKLEVS